MFMKRIPKEEKTYLVEQIQSYADLELSTSIGQLAAENLLDFVATQLGPHIYNQAIKDARAVILQQMERVDDELYTLEQRLR